MNSPIELQAHSQAQRKAMLLCTSGFMMGSLERDHWHCSNEQELVSLEKMWSLDAQKLSFRAFRFTVNFLHNCPHSCLLKPPWMEKQLWTVSWHLREGWVTDLRRGTLLKLAKENAEWIISPCWGRISAALWRQHCSVMGHSACTLCQISPGSQQCNAKWVVYILIS